MDHLLSRLQLQGRRARSLFGAARAAELAGDSENARRHYEQLVQLMADADGERPELRRARAFLMRG